MSSLKGTVSQKVLSGTMKKMLSEFDSTLKKKELQYATELDLACEVVRRDWSSRGTMTDVWVFFCDGPDNFASVYGSATDEFKYYLDSREESFGNFILYPFRLLTVKPERPKVTHVMLDSDWDTFWENVVSVGNDLIDTIQDKKPKVVVVACWGRNNTTRNYTGLINDMLKQHINIVNMDALFVGRNLRERFQVLLDKVVATELDSITLDDDSLALIHEFKGSINV